MSTLLPSSSVNTMSSDDDKCFQCQETGHMACYFPCIRCFNCNDYGHVTADYPNKILPSGIPAKCRDNNSHTRRHDRSISRNNHCNRHHHCDHQDRHRFSRSQSHNPRFRSNSCSDSHIMPQKLKHISLLTRHPTQQILIMQEFLQRQQ